VYCMHPHTRYQQKTHQPTNPTQPDHHLTNKQNHEINQQSQESRGATARYAESLGPVLDPHLLQGVLALLRAYPDLIEARVLGGRQGGGVGCKGGSVGAGRRKLTPGEVKVGVRCVV
jgi:hypothetical protein